jgi:hypothetical protein
VSAQEMRKFARELKHRGFEIEHTGGGHLKLMHPLLSAPIFTGSTPSDGRALKNLKASIRKFWRGSKEEGV